MAPVPSTEARGPLCPHLRYAWKRAVVDTRAPHPRQNRTPAQQPLPRFCTLSQGAELGLESGSRSQCSGYKTSTS